MSSKLAKVSREVSNFIVDRVLERSDVLIRNSYRRLTLENEARNEQWAQVTEEVNSHFDPPIDVEKIRSHFHNRKKKVFVKIKEALRPFANLSIDEKMEEISRRNMLQTEIDLRLVRVCLEVEEEEKLRIDGEHNQFDQMRNLLNEKTVTPPSALANEAPLLSRMLTEQQEQQQQQQPSCSERPAEKLSHLIVDITSTDELKRLLSVLIDNGFCRFQHVEDFKNHRQEVIQNDIVREIQSRQVEQVNVDVKIEEDDFESYESIPDPAHNFIPQSAIDSQHPDSGESSDDVENNELIDDEEEVKTRSLALFKATKEEILVPPPVKRRKTSFDSSSAIQVQCEKCDSGIRLNPGASKWNLYEHAVLRHSTFRPYQCTECDYRASRKIRVRQHTKSQHNLETKPLDITTPEARRVILQVMAECFPNHQYGKNTIASRCQ